MNDALQLGLQLGLQVSDLDFEDAMSQDVIGGLTIACPPPHPLPIDPIEPIKCPPVNPMPRPHPKPIPYPRPIPLPCPYPYPKHPEMM